MVVITMTKVVDEVLSLITNDNDNTSKPQRRELRQNAIDEAHTVDREHTLGVILGVFTQTTPHSCG